ncbi:MAG TPA: hypothetical protein PKD83_07485 [Ignavibacteria bacterium]|nr:hypothetical protein [Ignavibacteria bacterium]
MKIRKLILTVFILFSLSFSYQPVSGFTNLKAPVVFVLDVSKDKVTNEFLKAGKSSFLRTQVSLTIQCLILNRIDYYNSS